MTYAQLPAVVRKHVEDVRAECRKYQPDLVPKHKMQGITQFELDGDGLTDVYVWDGKVCNGRHAGVNCSNRACNFSIYKQVKPGRWKLVFEESLYGQYVVLDWWKALRFQLLVAAIYAGDKECEPDPKMEYSSGFSCNVLIRYRKGRFEYERIRVPEEK